ncbi:ketodeoxygluconokinase [Vibrio sp. qd031]|uniref:sugar kinase n=1 Tax=Vibrio sp. qd031 TaxID=1603038 RepID=UPI000A230DA0|nr:sugar kinase [Vibrio sp. qd031]ORT48757.1 ketodeoxygluconokinase [Vibrio sp. qd031]
MTAAMNIAVIGECMIELQDKDGRLEQAFGGDTLNTATYLARLTGEKDISTSYVTALGKDAFSRDMKASWDAEGIDTSLILTVEDKQPGIYYIETDDTGERTFFYWRNDSAAKYLFEQADSAALVDKLMTFDAVYLSGITLAILTEAGREVLFNFLKAFSEKGGKVLFDNNYRPKLWENAEQAQQAYAHVLSCTDIALLTFDDEQDLYGDSDVEQCIERSLGMGVGELIIKRGSKDCLVVTEEKSEYVAPTLVKNVVDTTAAGDSFSAGFLAKRFTGGTATQAAKAGHVMAGTVIQHKGAVIDRAVMPTIEL